MFQRRTAHRRILGCVLGLAMTAASVGIAANPASAATSYRTPVFECIASTHTVKAYFPQDVRTVSGNETVYWTADLYRWNGSDFALWDGSRPWYYSVATPNGLRDPYGQGYTWRVLGTNGGVTLVSFPNLPSGIYAIAGYYYGGPITWSTLFGTSLRYCVE